MTYDSLGDQMKSIRRTVVVLVLALLAALVVALPTHRPAVMMDG